jgi:hypothetical protein
MMWNHAAAQELLDALLAKAAELDEWDPQRAQEDERRRDTSVDFMGLNLSNVKGTNRSMRSSTAERRRSPEAIIAPRMQVRPSGGALPASGRSLRRRWSDTAMSPSSTALTVTADGSRQDLA